MIVGKDGVISFINCCNGILLHLFSYCGCDFPGTKSSVPMQKPLTHPNENMDVTALGAISTHFHYWISCHVSKYVLQNPFLWQKMQGIIARHSLALVEIGRNVSCSC